MPSARRRHYRITEADALKAHEIALRTGGRPGIRDWNQVLSAIGRPYHGYLRPIAWKAAALLQAIATSHGFTDGNKRTAIILTSLLIEASGYVLAPIDDREDLEQAIEDFTVGVVERAYDQQQMRDWFKDRIRKA